MLVPMAVTIILTVTYMCLVSPEEFMAFSPITIIFEILISLCLISTLVLAEQGDRQDRENREKTPQS